MRSVLLVTLAVSAGCLKAPGADRRPVPMAEVVLPTDQPTVDAYIARAQQLGCKPEPAPGSGLPALYCETEAGRPRFIFHDDNTVWCGIAPGDEQRCRESWAKIADR
ncbi:MAG: hypothetical protein JNL83_19880 [Myxococcales bacterium]|nr:hypothetical protein [Myxococcales bacterium]